MHYTIDDVCYFNWQFLRDGHDYTELKLSKNYRMNKTIFIGSKWVYPKVPKDLGLYIIDGCWCWHPLSFERNVLYA